MPVQSQFRSPLRDPQTAAGPKDEKTADRQDGRTRARRIVVAACAAVALALAATTMASPRPVPRLVIHTTAQTMVLDPSADEVVVAGAAAATSADGTTLIRSTPARGKRTLVTAMDTATGTSRWSRTINGAWSVQLASNDGATAVLGRGRHAGGSSVYAPRPRARTLLAVATAAGARRYDLDGNFEPEALSLDDSSVFVIQYTPARQPAAYQVRRLDLASGDVVDVYTPDAELQERMRGTARIQAASADGRRLYTLYSLDGAGGSSHAFVHVLSLDGLWAHCIDLPDDFSGDPATTAIALDEDGTRLHVFDAAAGALAELDTEELRVLGTASVDERHVASPTAAAVSGTSLYVADDKQMLELHPSTGALVGVTSFDSPIVGLSRGPHDLVYVATAREVAVFDRRTSDVLWTIDGPRLEDITGIGTSAPLSPAQEELECAC